MSNFFTYARFQTMDDAEMLTDVLTRHSVKYKIDHEANQLDKIYLGESLDPLFVIKIQQKDFCRVNGLLSSQAEADIQHPEFQGLRLVRKSQLHVYWISSPGNPIQEQNCDPVIVSVPVIRIPDYFFEFMLPVFPEVVLEFRMLNIRFSL